jgi:hypothetical protein
VIDTEESSEKSDFEKIMQDMEHHKLAPRVFALGRINRSVKEFTD